MKTNLAILLGIGTLALAACGGSQPAATDPSAVTTTTATPDPAAATPASPTAAAPTTTTTPADTTAATPATPATTPAAPDASSAKGEPCAAPKTTTKNLTSCKAECQKLDDKAPAGSKCIPPRAACVSNCNTLFNKVAPPK
jgi:hypothetical protein